jgi:hypothetical protein
MSDEDEIERLLREIDGNLGGGAPAPKRGEVATPAQSAAQPAAPGERGRIAGALRTGVVAGAVCGVGVSVVTFLISWLPFDQSPMNAGGGAFVGAFLTGTVLSLRGRG